MQDLVRQGEVFERNGELDTARATFKTAKDLDGEWQPAKQGLSRIQRAITQRNFQVAMSEGFREISSKNYDEARKGFSRAKKILPGSAEPEDGLLQVEQSERNDIILDHQKNAQAHLVSENWPGAIEEYEAALTIAESLEFALTGLTYAKSRLALQERLQGIPPRPNLIAEQRRACRSVLNAQAGLSGQTTNRPAAKSHRYPCATHLHGKN